MTAAPTLPMAPRRTRAFAAQHQRHQAALQTWRVPAHPFRPCVWHSNTAAAPTQARAGFNRHSHDGRFPQRSVAARSGGWGTPVEFSQAKVLSNTVEATGLHQIVVDIGSALATKYTRPGQYVQAKTQPEGKAGFFAIASPPGAGQGASTIELLIKVQPGATAEEICKLQAGAELLVSAPQGNGFPVDRIPPASFDTVLLFATGSGISPIKAVLDSDVLAVSKRKEVRLYYGSRNQDATAYKSLIPKWVAKGIKVVQVLSGNDKKYVQGAFAKDIDKLAAPGKVAVLLCGQKDMSIAIKELCDKKGVSKDAVLSNY